MPHGCVCVGVRGVNLDLFPHVCVVEDERNGDPGPLMHIDCDFLGAVEGNSEKLPVI